MALKLVLLGLVAGLFSALFGVGGGIVIVPLLILLLGFESKVATGTSLAAIGITALAGTILYAFEGHVDVAHAALVGLPAAAGAIVGTGVQQRVSGRNLTLAFAGLLAALAVWLLVVLAFYLAYGRRHAVLNTYRDLEEIAEPRGDEDR